MRGILRNGIRSTNVMLRTSPCTGQSEPTRGRKAHQREAAEYFKAFPDNRFENRPYLVLFGQGDWTCSVAIHTGTHKGPLAGPGRKTIRPTNKKFRVEFCTVAHWKNGEIVDERLFYDLTSPMRQLGLAWVRRYLEAGLKGGGVRGDGRASNHLREPLTFRFRL